MNKKFIKFLKKISTGAIKYEDPKNLNFSDIDQKVKKFVRAVNESSWCRTLWSCQGHKEKKNAIVLPYFTFVVKSEKKSYFLNLLYSTLPVNNNLKFPVHSTTTFEINKGYSNKDFSVISIHWSKVFVLDKKIRKNFFLSLNKIGNEIKNGK